MISNEDASYVIRQIRNIDWYISHITELEVKLSRASNQLELNNNKYKSPMDWQRITIDTKDSDGNIIHEDARYKAPGTKYPVNSKGLMFDYEDEIVAELQVMRYSLCKAMSYLELLKGSQECDFIQDFFDNKPYEVLRESYHISNVNRHMKSLIKQQIKSI